MIFSRIKMFWDNLLYKMGLTKKAYKNEPIDSLAQKYQDITKRNMLAVATMKLAHLSTNEATFEVKETGNNSNVCEPLKKLARDVQKHKREIVETALGVGDFYILPSIDESGELYHSYIDGSRARILECNNDRIKKISFILDYVQPKNNEICYFLQRTHELDKNGTLTIRFDTVSETGNTVPLDFWGLNDTVIQYKNANNIGVARFKSPVSNRGIDNIYGCPLNTGCGSIEREIFETLQQIAEEFDITMPALITDERNVTIDKATGKIKRIKGILPVKNLDKDDAFSIFNPNIRSSNFYEKLEHQVADLERQMGLSRGILTDNEALKEATATAVKRSNADTIAFISDIHDMLTEGFNDVIDADAMYLSISKGAYTTLTDYLDVFADLSEQFNQLIVAYTNNIISRERVLKWMYSSMSQEEIEEEIRKIDEEKANSTQTELESLFK